MKKFLIKIISLVLGFSIWYLYKQTSYEHINLDIPVYFYNNEDPHRTIRAPETVHVTLAGTRKNLGQLDKEHLAIHLDASRFFKPMCYTTLDSQNFFLPTTIKLVCYNPAPIPVEVLSQANKY
jgi:hypothetical protein